MDETDSGADNVRRKRRGRRRGDAEGEAAAADDAAPATRRLHRVRITKLAVLINTNKSYGTAGAGDYTVRELRTYLQERLFTKRGMYDTIVVESERPRRHILAVEVQAPSIEIGARQRLVHAHFILRIKHISRVVLGAMQRSLKRHVQANSIFANPFVSVRLLDGRADNYVLKEVEVESRSSSADADSSESTGAVIKQNGT